MKENLKLVICFKTLVAIKSSLNLNQCVGTTVAELLLYFQTRIFSLINSQRLEIS